MNYYGGKELGAVRHDRSAERPRHLRQHVRNVRSGDADVAEMALKAGIERTAKKELGAHA